jgi:hypothetical protein
LSLDVEATYLFADMGLNCKGYTEFLAVTCHENLSPKLVWQITTVHSEECKIKYVNYAKIKMNLK